MFKFLSFILGKILFFTGVVTGGGSFPKPLSKEEERECLEAIKKGDSEAKNKLVTHNMRLVAHVVKKYNGAADSDDLISVGSVGLLKAIDTYKIDQGTAFATYTARCIENEILMLLRANKKYRGDVSLFEPMGSDKDGNDLTLMDLLCESEDSVFKNVYESVEREKLLAVLKKALSKREYTVIVLRYGLKGGKAYAQREVAAFLRISRSYVSRIETKAIEKLKRTLKKEQFYC